MFADIHFIDFLRANPALAVFVTLALGFLVGKLRWRSFSLGTVTSVLLVGVVVGQLKIEIPEPAKTLFFLLFLFSVGYAVGPQFFRGLKRDGLPQVGFAVVVCLSCLGSTWLCATLMGYDVAQAAGLLAGSQTMSAVLGVATDTIRQLPDGQAIDLDAMPVCYAVTYIFGTAGSAWILGTLGPRLLGGVEKVHKAALDLESKLGDDVSFTAGFDPAARAIVFRAYKAENDWFGQRHTVAEFERYMQSQKKLIFVERLRQRGRIVDDVTPRTTIYPGDTLVVSGRRQYVIEEEDWIGTEVEDAELTNFSVQSLPVVVSKRGAAGQYVRNILKRKEMHGVNIRSILRAGVKIPVLAGGKLDAGDRLELVGLRRADARVQRSGLGKDGDAAGGAGHLFGRTALRLVADDPYRGRAAEPYGERRRADRRPFLRLAPCPLSPRGQYPAADVVVHEQRRPEHLHRHRRHFDRPDLHSGISGGRVESLSDRRGRDLDSARRGHLHRTLPLPVQRCADAGVRRGGADHHGGAGRRRGDDPEQRPLDGLHDHLCYRQYAAHHLGRGDRAADRVAGGGLYRSVRFCRGAESPPLGSVCKSRVKSVVLSLSTPASMKRITIKELAERLGLSPSTVSRALAGDRNIRRETRERVSRLAGELGYRPNPVAVNLRSGRSNTVGVIVPEMVTPFAATVIGGIQRVLYGRGLKVIIAQSDENPQTECGNLELMERFMVDGVIACPCDATRNGEIYRRIRQRGVPLVFYDRAPLRVDASRVIVDDFATSYFLMEHLVRRGCRRIVHLGGPAHIPNARERLRGFRYALGKFGFVSDGRSVIPAGVTFDDGRAAADELLRRMPDADGLFAWTDTVAIGAMNRLRELGIRVPAQMAVAGYSGTVLSTIVNPQLTTVEQPLDEMGCRAAELILEKIADPSAPDRTVTLTACIRERASTAR